MGTLLKWLGGVAVGGFFVWLSARSGQFDRLLATHPHLDGFRVVGMGGGGTAVWALDLRWLVGFLAVLVAVHFLRVARWRPLLSTMDDVPFWVANRVAAVGFMAVFLLPFRLGEFVRPALIARERPRIPMSSALATIVVERIADGLSVTGILFLVLLTAPVHDAEMALRVRGGGAIALLVFASALVAVLLVYWKRRAAVRALEAVMGIFGEVPARRIAAVTERFLEGFHVLPRLRPLAAFLGLTLVYWTLLGTGFWMLARGFGLDLPVRAGHLMMSCAAVGMMIPNSPGNVGTYWFFLLLPVSLWGLDRTAPAVVAYGLTNYLCQLLQQTLFGLYFIVTGKVGARAVAAATHAPVLEPAEETTPPS